MIEVDIASKFKFVRDAVASICEEHGFVANGLRMRLISDGNCGVVEMQKSKYCTADDIEFTVKFGIVCGELLLEDNFNITSSKIIDAQFRVDAGYFNKELSVDWWHIVKNSDERRVANDVVDIVCESGLPYILKYIKTDNLKALWESGESPGLTKHMRQQYLTKLGLR